jgi:hypothetical protein
MYEDGPLTFGGIFDTSVSYEKQRYAADRVDQGGP